MKAGTLKYLTILFICTFFLMGFRCKGSINGHLILIPPGEESTDASQDSWPCDTTDNPVMIICLFEETEGLIECIEENFDDIPEEFLTDEVPDTITIYFGELESGNYYLGIFCKNPGTEFDNYNSVGTWYHPEIDSVGLIKKKEDSQGISVTNSQRNIELVAIKIKK